MSNKQSLPFLSLSLPPCVSISCSHSWSRLSARVLSDYVLQPAKDAYLHVASSLPLYGSTIFTDLSTPSEDKTFPAKFSLAINLRGVHVIHDETKVCTRSFMCACGLVRA